MTNPGSYGVVTSISSYVNGANDVKVADFNNDNKLDLVVTSSLHKGFAILLGDGTGNFNPIAGLPFSQAGEVVVADFNSDGKADLALMSDKVYILLGDGTGHFTNSLGLDAKYSPPHWRRAISTGTAKLILAVTSDNRDFLGLVQGSGSLSIFPGNGAGGFAARRDFETGWSPMALTVGEFNGDGKLDVATADAYNDNISVFAGDGSGNFLPAMTHNLGTDPTRILSGNFNGDGKLDLVITRSLTNSVLLIFNNYTGPQPCLSISGDLHLTEGNAGTNEGLFTVTLSKASAQTVKVNYSFEVQAVWSLSEGFAVNGRDYQEMNGTLIFAPGETTKTFPVKIKGDMTDEPDESSEFFSRIRLTLVSTAGAARHYC